MSDTNTRENSETEVTKADREVSLVLLYGIELRDSADIKNWIREYQFSEKGLWLPNPFGKVSTYSIAREPDTSNKTGG